MGLWKQLIFIIFEYCGYKAIHLNVQTLGLVSFSV